MLFKFYVYKCSSIIVNSLWLFVPIRKAKRSYKKENWIKMQMQRWAIIDLRCIWHKESFQININEEQAFLAVMNLLSM